ncbi:hypothetical protein ACVWWI_006339 [Bradyrhizobium sp. USDA 3686]|nr:hypothetical protein [Bradyrhizobium canariense]
MVHEFGNGPSLTLSLSSKSVLHQRTKPLVVWYFCYSQAIESTGAAKH